jgi:hypothetical protein
MGPNMNKTVLNKLEKKELINLIIELSKLNKQNKAFLETQLSLDFNNLFELSCKKIDKAFCCYELMSLKDARSALNDLKKSKPSNELFIDLCLYYIKSAYSLEKTSWKFQENFYLAIENVFKIIIEIIKTNPVLKEEYNTQLQEIIKQANEGWGHQDELKEIYKLIK